MSMIEIKNFTFAYESSGDYIFKDINVIVDTDWKLGLVGRNGRGKTTLLQLLLGKYEYRGEIKSTVQFDYFPYAVKEQHVLTIDVFADICYEEEWKIKRELSYLDEKEDILWQMFDTLSKGQQTKVLLAALFLNEGHFLLIDEPNHHLDKETREKVGHYLKKKKSFILVSHDRYFLDSCIDHVLSINKMNIEIQIGNYSSWLEHFKNTQKKELSQNEYIKKDMARLKRAMLQTRQWSNQVEASKIGAADKGYVGHKAAKMMKRSKNIEFREKKALEKKGQLLKNIEVTDDLKMNYVKYHKDVLLAVKDVTIMYDSKHICQKIDFTLHQGERISIEGRNGRGKISLLKLIMKEDIAYEGDIKRGSQLLISYVNQNTDDLSGDIVDYVHDYQIDESLFKTILRKMGFERIQFDKKIEEFSKGQKKKLVLARSLCEKAHLYIWDEPLNYLDVYTRQQIENVIKEYQPTMLFIDHDRFFSDEIATTQLRLEKNNNKNEKNVANMHI